MSRCMYAFFMVAWGCLVFASSANADEGELQGSLDPLVIRVDGQVVVQRRQWLTVEPGGELLETNGIQQRRGDRLREELGIHGDTLEYTFRIELPARDETQIETLFLPLVPGATARVSHGSYRKTRTTTVTPLDQAEDVRSKSDEVIRFARFVQVIEPDGGGYSLDLDPAGPRQDLSDFDAPIRQARVQSAPGGLWLHYQREDNLWGGGQLNGKMMVYPNSVAYESLHSSDRSGYKMPMPLFKALDFTPRQRSRSGERVGRENYNKQTGYGFITGGQKAQLVQRSGRGYHDDSINSRQPAVFRVDCLPGDYFVTAIVGDAEQSTGPMSIVVNGKACVVNERIPAGRHEQFIFSVDARDGVILLELTGLPWRLNALTISTAMLNHEDFSLRRDWWLKP